MIPASFDYLRAGSLRDALAALAAGDGTKVLAGGHSLLPMMRFRLAQPARLVDIAGLPELQGIKEQRRGARIGAGTTYRDLLQSELLRDRFPILAECAEHIGDRQVRNRGTIGGGLAHADPASDMPAVMLALDATFNLRSKHGRRSVQAREFFHGPFSTALADDELLIDIVLPPLPKGAGAAYVSQEQAASGYPLAGAAVVVARTRRTLSYASAAFAGVSDRPWQIRSTELLLGTKAEPDVLAKVVGGALEGIEVNGDIHAPVEYRRHLAAVMLRRALDTALERAR